MKTKLDEETIQECFSVDNDAAAVLQLTDSEIAHMVIHPNKGTDTGDEIGEGTSEHTSTDKCMT